MKLWNFLKNLWHPQTTELSLPQLIWNGRHYRRLFVSFSVLTLVSTSLLYLQAIWPIFFKADISNSVVQKYITSNEFKAYSGQMFDELERYNTRRSGETPSSPRRFVFGGVALGGLVLSGDYKLAPQEEIDTAVDASVSGLKKSTYAPEFTISLDPRFLTLYIFSMVVLLVVIVHTIIRIFGAKHDEDRLLDQYNAAVVSIAPGETSAGDPVDALANLLGRFHAFAKQIIKRHADRTSITFNDEYDVQDALHALLKLHYLDVRDEECTPSYAGKSSRMDFFVNDNKIGVEVKKTRKQLTDSEIGDQLIIDIGRYQKHEGCETLVCLIYDPQGMLSNPHGLITDLEDRGQTQGMKVKVVVSPLH